MQRLRAAVLVSALLVLATPVRADMPMNGTCADKRIAEGVVQAIAAWAQNFPFARVIIGDEGGNGTLVDQRIISQTDGWAQCHARYELWRTAKDGHRYNVAIEPISFKVEDLGGGYQVTLQDMPLSLKDSKMSSGELLARFSVDGRPYLDILAENQRRIQQRRGAVGQ